MRSASTHGLCIVFLCFGLHTAAAEDGFVTEYDVLARNTMRKETGTIATEQNLHVCVYTLPAAGGRNQRFIVTITGNMGPEEFPLGIAELGDAGLVVEVEHPRGRAVSRILGPVLEHGVPPARRERSGAGREPQDFPALFARRVPLRFETATEGEGDSAEVTYTVRLDGGPHTTRTEGAQVRLTELVREWRFRQARVTHVRWSHSYERESGDVVFEQAGRLEITETARRPLSEAEWDNVAAEVAWLEPVVEALLPGAEQHLRRNNEATKLADRLDRYAKKFPQPVLSAVVPGLKERFERVRSRLLLPEDPEEIAKLMRDKPAPDFQLKDLAGNAVSLKDLRGKAVLLNFWAVLCGRCRAEALHLSAFAGKYETDGLVVLGINADNYPRAGVEEFAIRLKLRQKILLDGNGVAIGAFHLKRWPTNIYIDRRGNIADHDFGFAQPAEIEAKIQKILASPGE